MGLFNRMAKWEKQRALRHDKLDRKGRTHQDEYTSHAERAKDARQASEHWRKVADIKGENK